MIQTLLRLGHIQIGLAVVAVVVTVGLVSSFPQPLDAQDAQMVQQAQAARLVAITAPLSVTTDQSLEFVFSLPVAPANQPNPPQFRLILQDAETGSVFGQKEIQISGGIPGGGCIELTVDQGGHILIDGQPTNFMVQPGTRKAVVGVLLPLRLPGQARFVASLQLFDNAMHRTVSVLPALQ